MRATNLKRARSRAGASLKIMLVLMMVALAGGMVADAPPARAADAGMSKPVYGANEAVIIAVGNTDYVRNCQQIGGAAVPVNDWLYGVSDVYVVPSTWSGGALSDISGEPNVIFGQMGGAFVDEVIGYTAPGGTIPPGRYGIVFDNCQDKHFDPAVDTFIPDAFRVTSDVRVPPIDIAAIKADARQRSEGWMDAQYTFTGLMFAANAWELYGVLTDPADGLIFFIQDAFVKSAGLPDAKVEARNLLLSTARHWGGIAADPPNYAYDQPVSPGAVANLESFDTDPMLRAQVALGEQVGIEGSLANGLLESIEKYQGAAADRNGVWARQHARSAQRYAQALAAQLPKSAAAASEAATQLRADPDDLDATMHGIGDLLIDARTNGFPQELRTKAAALGMSPAELEAGARGVDNMGLSGISKEGAAGTLDTLVAQTATMNAQLANLVSDLDTVIAQLDADPMMTDDFVTASAGGPYAAATGATITLDATASTGVGPLTYAWDLDGDAAFDDATGATPSFTVASTTPGLLSVKVTGVDGIADIATAPFTNTESDPGPQLGGRTPTNGVVDMTSGETRSFSITPSDAGGGPVTTSWWSNGVAAGSGNSFNLVTAPGEVGSRMLTAIVTDSAGQQISTTWWVRVTGTDADGDGWPVPLDCNDADATVNPGAPDVANGIDDDCDPATSDGTPAPTVTILSGTTSLEGVDYVLNGSMAGGSGPVTRTIDWGDGSAQMTNTWSSAYGFNMSYVPHTYVNDGTYTIRLCARRTTSPFGCAYQTVTVDNQAPAVNFVDLTTWEEILMPPEDIFSNQGASEWVVAPTRDSVLQTRNSDPSVFLSPDSFVGSEATVEISVESDGDDDFIGFVIGGSPGMFRTGPQHYLLVDWKQGTQLGAPRGLAVSEVQGVINGEELWLHHDQPESTGTITELARGATLGDVGWTDLEVYQLRFRYTADRLQVWIDDVLELDVSGDFPTDARLGFYNYSQHQVRYQGFVQTAISIPEGTTTPFNGYFVDPGVEDTQSGLFTWGDGSPDDRVEVISSVNGVGDVTASHRYLDDGTYPSELCITDDGGDTGCQQRSVLVTNVAPVVDAGRDRVAGPDLVLDDSVFTDVGVVDTHTATVNWGDGSPVETVVVSEDLGSGIVSAAHRYSVDGSMTVEVCVTDDDGATGCDTFVATVRSTNGALQGTGEPDLEVFEGDLVARQVAFEDDNPSDTHTGSITWGDGTGGPMAVQDGGDVGVASAVHRYRDNGAFPVVGEICDDRGTCTSARSTITVLNVAPTLTAAGSASVRTGEVWSLSGTWADVGLDDTHVVTIDWGDGTASQVSPSVLAPGSGEFVATHQFGQAGDHNVRVCVVDDDEGSSCTTVVAGITQAPPPDTEVPNPSDSTTTSVIPSAPSTAPIVPVEVTPSSLVGSPAVAAPYVTPSAPVTGQLPQTGSSLLPAAMIGVLLALGGAVVLAVGRVARRGRGEASG